MRGLFMGVDKLTQAINTDNLLSLDDMANGHIDIQTLGEAVNEDKIVTSRMGLEYPSAPMASRLLVENGLLGATPFSTYTALTASALVDGDYAIVTNDNSSRNGVYIKDGADFLRLSYNYDTVVKEVVSEKIESNTDDMIYALSAANDVLVHVIDKKGGHHLPFLDGSVQSCINELNEYMPAVREHIGSSNNDALLNFTDAAEKTYATFDKDAHLHLYDLDESVQSSINKLEHRLTTALLAINTKNIDVSDSLVPRNYTFSANDLLNIRCNVPDTIEHLTIDSPYRKDDGFVHPCFLALAERIRGYKYVMVITPYYHAEILEENPVIYGSNDMHKWEMFTDIPQPLDNPPDWDEIDSKGYLSDPWLSYDPNTKELICCWRKAYTVGSDKYNPTDTLQLLYSKTKNGLQWSEPSVFYPDTEFQSDALLSPSLLWMPDQQLWGLFYMKVNRYFVVRTNPDFTNPNGWSAPAELGFDAFARANNITGKHLEVKWLGNRLVALISNTADQNTYLACSDVGSYTQWNYTATPLLTYVPNGTFYKSSFIPIFDDNNTMQLQIMWTDIQLHRRVFTHPTNAITINEV